MYNIYKDSEKIGQTADKTFVVDGLQPDTEYTLGVTKVEGNEESAVTTVTARTHGVEEELPNTDEGAAEEGVTTLSDDISAYHVGGGYYDIDGERVRGKDAAQALLDEVK